MTKVQNAGDFRVAQEPRLFVEQDVGGTFCWIFDPMGEEGDNSDMWVYGGNTLQDCVRSILENFSGRLDLDDLRDLLTILDPSEGFLHGFLLSAAYIAWRDTDQGPVQLYPTYPMYAALVADLDPDADFWAFVTDESQEQILNLLLGRLIDQPLPTPLSNSEIESLGTYFACEGEPPYRFRGDNFGLHLTREEPC